jgi:voltage-gated potassium channel
MTVVEPWRTVAYDRFERWTQWPLLALSLALIPILIIPVAGSPSSHERHFLDDLDWIIWIVFVVDYGARLYLAGGHRKSFIRHNLFDLALVAVPMLRPLRLARVARVVRVGRLGALLGSTSHRQQTSLRSRALLSVAIIAGSLTLLCSVLELDSQRGEPGANIHGFGDALWWAFSTVSTVGYGDSYPVGTLGRLIAVVLMIAGVALFGTVTAAVASWFVQHFQDDTAPAGEDLPARLDRVEASLARIEAALGQNFEADA